MIPKNSTKFTTNECMDFNHYMARGPSIEEKQTSLKPMPDYDPSKEHTQRSLSLGIMPFNK